MVLLTWASSSLTCRDRERCGVWGAVSTQLNSRGCGVVVDMGDFSLTCNDGDGGVGGRESVCVWGGGGGGGAIFTH